MNSSKREKMLWTKSRKRPGLKKLFFSFADKRLFPLIDLTLPIFSPQSLYEGRGVPDCKTSREFDGLFFLRALGGVRSVCFIGRRHDPVDSRFYEV